MRVNVGLLARLSVLCAVRFSQAIVATTSSVFKISKNKRYSSLITSTRYKTNKKPFTVLISAVPRGNPNISTRVHVRGEPNAACVVCVGACVCVSE